MRHGVLAYFLLFFIAVSLIGGSVLTTYTQFIEDGPLTEAKDVVIPKGRSLKQVARLLKREGVIESPAIFELGVRASGNTLKIKSGEYNFPRQASAKLVMNILTDGQTVARRFVAPEGMTSAQIVELMDKYLGLVGEVQKIPPDGTLLPETYNYSYGDTKESLLKRMQESMDKKVAELWAKRDKNVPFKTSWEAVIMASIVEKETARPEERPHIASVFFNRLKKHIRLQSDPTVIYAITNGKLDLKRALTYADLKVQNPYNTYVVYGLPQGPIANPGAAALAAVLNPMETDDIYFVADGKGGHVFSPTYEEHQKNVTRWRQSKKKKKVSKSVETALPAQVDQPNESVQEGQLPQPTDAIPASDSLQQPQSQVPLSSVENEINSAL
ncbi:MAG: endolytic transglycosylase MltG [Alphaproteobacteria bacterium]|nr:endolytic transglycosylase MltG [Alphaproteobacteria bacterium]